MDFQTAMRIGRALESLAHNDNMDIDEAAISEQHAEKIATLAGEGKGKPDTHFDKLLREAKRKGRDADMCWLIVAWRMCQLESGADLAMAKHLH